MPLTPDATTTPRQAPRASLAASTLTSAEQAAQRGCGTHGQGRGKHLWELQPAEGGMGLLVWLRGPHLPGAYTLYQGISYRVVKRWPGALGEADEHHNYLRRGDQGNIATAVRQLVYAIERGDLLDQLGATGSKALTREPVAS